MLQHLTKKSKSIAVLIDPDKVDKLPLIIQNAIAANIDFFLVGGSHLSELKFENTIQYIKDITSIPVIIFPGNSMQISEKADGILFLSLVSGRNSDFLIGQQVLAAPIIARKNIKTFPTGYLLIDGGKVSSTQYISQTIPLPADKEGLIVATALAAKMLGMDHIYLEAGSGAINPVATNIIKSVKNTTNAYIIVGGGIRSAKQIEDAFVDGADLVVLGTIMEQNPEFLFGIFSK